MRMGPVALIRLTKGYGRELPPGHAGMLRGDGVKPEWAREYGSGNSGEAGVRESETRAERVRRLLAAEASERERQARMAEVAAEEERVAEIEAAEGGGECAVREAPAGVEGLEEGEAEVMPVRAIEVGGEARGDEARPLPMRHPLKRPTRGTQRARVAEERQRAEKREGNGEQWWLRKQARRRSGEGGSQQEARNQRRKKALGARSMLVEESD